MDSAEELDSVWLFNVLDMIGLNNEYRSICQQAGIMKEILVSFERKNSFYFIGSSVEGTIVPGEIYDVDAMQCFEYFPVVEHVENIDKTEKMLPSLLMVKELDTPAGYVKLQLVMGHKPYISKHWCNLRNTDIDLTLFTVDRIGRIVLFDLPKFTPYFRRTKNKPARYPAHTYCERLDWVISYRCRQWPTCANEWLIRERLHGWPSETKIQELSSLGFFVVRKGHPLSPEIDLEWCISFSLQERKLMFGLTDVQHKCYTILKILNRDIVKSSCITSYHWKTCLFYVIEENDENIWKQNLLFHCVKLNTKKMLKWVKRGVCPNYFIPEENLFDGLLNYSWRLILEKKLNNILNVGFECLLRVFTGNISSYFRSRKSLKLFHSLQSNSEKLYREMILTRKVSIFEEAYGRFIQMILECYYQKANTQIAIFIQFLWGTQDHIKKIDIITEHSPEETELALSFLKPHIYTCLASNISSMVIYTTNTHVRDFLLFGSFTYFMKGGLSGKLKFLSVLYAFGLYEDCEWFLDQLDEDYIKCNPSVCICRYIEPDSMIQQENIVNTSQINVSTCVFFLQTELPITPDPLKYEMFRYFGISLQEKDKLHDPYKWHYRAVIDLNIFFLLLKFLIKRKCRRFQQSEDAIDNVMSLLLGTNVRHRDVASNVVAWMKSSDGLILVTLLYLDSSWTIMNDSSLCEMIFNDEMKRKQYHFNAAKLHWLVILYNIWFARERSILNFCFNCFFRSRVILKHCSRCKISTYCSKKCQEENWKFHKEVCKIVRRTK